MKSSPKIRRATANDFDGLADVMFDAVRNGASAYTQEQRHAWLPEVRHGADWTSRLSAQTILVAQTNGLMIGFMSLAAQGYIDFAFIRPGSRGSGLFRQIYGELEQLAIERGERRLWVHASLMAQPAFSAVGFEVVNEDFVAIANQTLRRFEMQKFLDATKPTEFDG